MTGCPSIYVNLGLYVQPFLFSYPSWVAEDETWVVANTLPEIFESPLVQTLCRLSSAVSLS